MLVMNIHLRFIFFCERDDTRLYRIGTRSEPPSLTGKTTDFGKISERLDFYLTWCMDPNHTNNDEMITTPFGSWFCTVVDDKCNIQSDLDYIAVIPYPPNESLLKDYLDFLITSKTNLVTDSIFKVIKMC